MSCLSRILSLSVSQFVLLLLLFARNLYVRIFVYDIWFENAEDLL